MRFAVASGGAGARRVRWVRTSDGRCLGVLPSSDVIGLFGGRISCPAGMIGCGRAWGAFVSVRAPLGIGEGCNVTREI